MADLYSRVASMSLKKETTTNVAVTPNVYIPFNDENLAIEYGYTPSMPVSSNRAKNLRTVINKIPAPTGTINVNVEPKTFGHFLNGIFGGVSSGRYLPYTGASAAFTVGETVTGGTSAATGVVVADTGRSLLISGGAGTFTAAETITGGGSGSTATVSAYNANVYGHYGKLPDSSIPTYSLQINFADSAHRLIGVRFTGIDALAQSDNIITAGIKVMAQGHFRHAKVMAITTSGAGAKTITVDQTYGLVDSDSVKLYRPGTGFLDFSAASTKTHTINSVASTTTFTITNLETATAVGDLIMLAPQTASYTIASEFPWIGGSEIFTGATPATAVTQAIEDFNFVVDNEFEERHAAEGNLFEDRFPSVIIQKGVVASGSVTAHYQDEDFIRLQRLNTAQALLLDVEGSQISTYGINYGIEFLFPEVQYDPYQTNIPTDEVVNEEIPFSAFYNTTKATIVEGLLINEVTSY